MLCITNDSESGVKTVLCPCSSIYSYTMPIKPNTQMTKSVHTNSIARDRKFTGRPLRSHSEFICIAFISFANRSVCFPSSYFLSSPFIATEVLFACKLLAKSSTCSCFLFFHSTVLRRCYFTTSDRTQGQ